jgi:RNA polymerase sigma-70 factor (ECF subfamily)
MGVQPATTTEAGTDAMAAEITIAGELAIVEDRLAVRCRAGDTQAFNEIVSRYQLRLFRFAYRLLRDRNEAEDAVQETFVRAYRALPAYRPSGYFSSWIYSIALNECRRRMRGFRPAFSLDLAPAARNAPDPQLSVLNRERNRHLREAIDALPEHYRLVMILFYFEEMSVEEVSRALKLSISAVKVRLHRARERLAKRLELDL